MNSPEIVAASCQRLALQWLDTLSIGGTALVLSIGVAIILKILAVSYLTKQLKTEYERSGDSNNSKLPEWLTKISEANNFPASKIFIDSKNQNSGTFTLGFFNPLIVISQKTLKNSTRKQSGAIILHEIYHAKRFHALTIASANMIAEILFFLPIIKGMAAQFSNYCEQSADKFVISKQKTNRYLLEALKNALSDFSKESKNTAVVVVLAAFAAENIENRITAIKEKRFVLGFPEIKQHLITVTILVLFGVLAVSSQKIEASVSKNLYQQETPGSCSIWQCASSCFSKSSYSTPNKNHSEFVAEL